MLKSVSSVTNAIGALNYKGTWNASTNTPTIVSSVGEKGDYYVVSVAGTTNINGISNWGIGDWIVFNGAVWQRVEGGADLNGVNITFTGTASGPTYETSNAAKGLTITSNEIDADGTDTNIDVLIDPKGTGGVGIGGAPTGVVAGSAITSKFCVKADGDGQEIGAVHANNTTAASGAGLFACRSRGTVASPTAVQNGDRLATLAFAGHDGTDLALAAQINVVVDGAPAANDMPGRIVFLTTPSGSQTPVARMTIKESGNVGIGTAGPNERLSVVGTSGSPQFGAGTASNGLFLNVFDNASMYYTASVTNSTEFGFGAASNIPLFFMTNNQDRMRLSNTGTLTCAGVYNTTVGGTNRDVFVDNTGLIGYVSSTRESKTNIEELNDVSWLLDLKPVTFNYRKKDEDGSYTEEADGPIEFGLIAEETESVKPELCFYDEVDGEMVLRGISYSKLVTPLMKLVQQQQTAIEQLTQRVSELESKGS